MEYTQQTQKTQGPAPLSFFRIPSPMHSSSRLQKVAAPTPQPLPVSASPQGLQLPEQGFNLHLQAEADAMMQTSTPLAIQTPSNAATTQWRTMVCPGAPMHPHQGQPSELQRLASMSTPMSSVSPASQWSVPTPHRSLSFEGCGGWSVPSTPTGLAATPTGIGLNTAFIASTPVNEGRVTVFDGGLNMFAMRERSLSVMSMGSDATPSMMVRPQ
eukprot:gnl/MRDRNA2_/MRDRNA2_59243_c0_seq1.p1 gnl/MRDRNA2_/MRDRNA2_59243_c0~~gnl/MRDRNA2_/MRDRNA2_59243_c0_seq1.p1  ORF type:complete len:214 (+),score=28.48 gnl/MRDRNA2_/MRDRNA2_59243_c0_seq1:109-750(+)